MRAVGLVIWSFALASSPEDSRAAAPKSKPVAGPEDPEKILARLGAHTIRGVSSDLCYPATAEEYEAIGKNAVLMLKASSALSTELPLKSAYLEVKGLHVPLQRFALLDEHAISDAGGDAKTEQVSFYLVPLALLKEASSLAVDFTGDRKSFGVLYFERGKALDNAPAFVRLDEYNSASDPDMGAVRALMAREVS